MKTLISAVNKIFKFCLSLFCVAIFTDITLAQDLSTIGEKPFWKQAKISGGIGGSMVGYNTKGQESQRPPFYWVVNANINIDVYGMAIPFSATFTSQNQDFTQPFNQFGLSPKYKWATAHLGFRSMQFSQYSLAGLTFFGAGVELEIPKSKFTVKAMAGRLIKAIPLGNGQGVISEEPAFERWGYGANIGYKTKGGNIGFTAFKAQDIETSINTDSLALLKPGENLVVAVTLQQKIGKRLSFNGEYALSTFTKDKRLEAVETNEFGYENNFNWLVKTNTSTVVNAAFSGNLTYTVKVHSFGITYRRVGPEYQTMGSTYLNNDLEEVTGNLGTSILKRKLNFAGSLGFQRNNLSNNLFTTDKRIIGSANLTWMATKRIVFSGIYSNYRASSDPSAINIQDTIRFVQVTANYGLMASYSISNEKLGHNVVLSNNYQRANSISEGDLNTVDNGSEFFNSNLSYTLGFIQSEINLTAAINYNQFASPGTLNESFGPTLSISKPFYKKKLVTMIGYTLFNNYLNKDFQDTSSNILASLGLSVAKHHQVKLDGRFLSRKSTASNIIEETQIALSYNYSF